MGDDLDIGGGDVGVLFDEMGAENAGKELWGCDGILFGFDVDCIFHGISGYDDTIVGLCVSELC